MTDKFPEARRWVDDYTKATGGAKAYIAHQLAGSAPALLAQVDELTARLDAAHDALSRIDGGDEDSMATLESTVGYVVDRWQHLCDAETAAADRVDELTAELAEARAVPRQSNELVAYANEDEQYLIWSRHHQSWWGPSRSGYRSNPDDAGRYTLAAAQAEMGRGCYCCRVPEVPVAAGQVIGRGDRAIQAALTEATELAVAAGLGNKDYTPPVVTVELPAGPVCPACDKPGRHPETCPTVPAELPEATR